MIAEQGVGFAAIAEGPQVARVEADRLAVVGQGEVVVGLAEVGVAAIEQQDGVARRLPQGFVVVGDGPIVLVLLGVGQAAVGVGLDVARLQTQRLGVIGDGRLDRAVARVDQGAAAVQRGVVRLQLDGPREVGDGLVELALPRVGVAAAHQDRHPIGIEFERRRVLGDGDVVQIVLDVANALAGLGQLRQAIEYHAEMLRASGNGPGGAVGEQLPPRFGQQQEIAAVRVGPAGQGKGAQFAETVDVRVRPDPHLTLGPADHLDRGVGDGAGDTAAQGRLRAGGGVAGAGVDQGALERQAGVQQFHAPARHTLGGLHAAEHHGGRPQAAVQQTAAVRRLQRPPQRPAHVEPVFGSQRPVLGDVLDQCLPLDVFQH